MNSVILIGRLTKDPEVRWTTGVEPKSVCTFTLAVDRRSKESESDFIRCVAFGKTADLIGQYMSKGRQIGVQGTIRTGSYEASDGTRKYTTDVYVNSFDFVVSKDDTAPAPNPHQQKPVQKNPNAIPEGFEVIDDSDVPF